MEISYDPVKRTVTLADRGLGFADAMLVFATLIAEAEDTRVDYGERRFVTAGDLRGRMVVLVWTPRDGTRRIISMRYAHEREQAFWRAVDQRLG